MGNYWEMMYMYEIGPRLLNIIMVITTVWIMQKYLNIFLVRKQEHLFSNIMWIIYFVFQYYVQSYAGQASSWTFLVGIGLIFIISYTNYYGHAKKNILIVLLNFAIGALIEIVIFFCLNFLHIDGKEGVIAGQVVSKIGIIAIVYLIKIFWKRDRFSDIPNRIYLLLFVVPTGSIFIAIHIFFVIDVNKEFISLLIFFGILLVFNIAQFEIYSKLLHFFGVKQENAIYIQQIEMISKNTEEQRKVMEEFRKEKHDLANELIILKHNIENEELSAAMKNLNAIIHLQDSIEKISMCGNNIIDSIINFKYTLAREKNINFILKLFIPEELPFEQCDLGIVVGNAIDNAIEATEASKEEEKQIKIIMGVRKESFVMIIENPYDGSLKEDKEGNLLSTKRDAHKHGYGVKSIKRVVEKYHGEMMIEINHGTFSLTITMNFR